MRLCQNTTERLSIWVRMVADTQPPSRQPLNGFSHVLASRLNRLPLPSLSLLDDVAQTREGEMEGKVALGQPYHRI